MKTFVLCLFVVVALAVVAARPEEKYTSQWDNIDVDAIIKNTRLMDSYVKCLLDEGHCNADGAELKRVLPEALKENCKKCTDAQKAGAEKILIHLIKTRRATYNKLSSKYDEHNEYLNRNRELLKKHGITV